MIEGIVEVFDKHFDSRTKQMHTCIPGTIELYEGHLTRRASVRPLIMYKSDDGVDIPQPVITNVPVIFPSSNSFSMLFPIERGDPCLLLFSETGIGNYLNSTIPGLDVAADDLSRFSLTDVMCLPGLYPFAQVPNPIINTDKIEFTGITDPTPGVLKLLAGTQSFVLGEILQTVLDTFFTSVSGITPGNTAQNAAALTAIKAAATAAKVTLPLIISQKIKGE